MDFIRMEAVSLHKRRLARAQAFVGGSARLESEPSSDGAVRGAVCLDADDVRKMLAAYTVTPEVETDFIRLLPASIVDRIRNG